MIIRHIKLLILSVQQLGIITGFRYFQTYLRALKNPNFVLEWADACEKHARKLEFFDPENQEAEVARSWAESLRACDREIREKEEQIDAQ
jgi:hypothetical protein